MFKFYISIFTQSAGQTQYIDRLVLNIVFFPCKSLYHSVNFILEKTFRASTSINLRLVHIEVCTISLDFCFQIWTIQSIR